VPTDYALEGFNEIHIEEDCSDLKGDHEKALFYGCTFNNVNGLTLKNCDLTKSQFTTETIKDAMGLTLTLDCLSFRQLGLSPLMFDLMLCLLTMTKGNEDRVEELKRVVGLNRYEAIMRVLKGLERNG
jgi:hypothetical protein